MTNRQGAQKTQEKEQQHKWRISVSDFEVVAKQKLDKLAYGYFSAGSDDEVTLHNNIDAFKKVRLYPRVLIDMSNVSLKTQVLGYQVNVPFGIAPFAMQKLIHPQGELLSAKEAFSQNTVYGLSMLSTTRPDQISKINPTGIKVQQLYLLKNAEYTRKFVQMTAKNGFHALALTVDTQTFGKRRIDKRNKFAPDASLEVFKQLGVDIRFDFPENPQKSFIQSINTRITWGQVKELRKLANQFSLKLILKGLSDEKDVLLAHQAGADAIWISNHGGRQLDTSPAGIQCLPAIKRQVLRLKSNMEVYVDGGIKKGTDIFKCLALGADFVFLGRGFLYSLVDGQSGVNQCFQILKKELKTTMMLSGTRNIKQITSDFVIFDQPYSKL